jgi:transposase
MKYKEYNINKKLFGENYIIYDWQECTDATHIYVKSQSRTGKCPLCRQESSHYHATYKRRIQIIPIKNNTTYANITAYKYDCTNENCSQKVFMEELPFVFSSQIRAIELNHVILAVSLFLSNESASKVLGFIGIKVSNDTIKRIYDSIEIQDEPEIEAVGIDDVAIRKGKSYATAIYDMKDHHLIALLNGRTAETLKEWLKSHKKIKLVTRDRASAYATAISEVLPDCVQVADRFHLLANLIEKMRDIFREEIPNEIYIQDGKILDAPPEKVIKYKSSYIADQLEENAYDNTPPVDESGNIIDYDNKCHNPDRQRTKKQAENRKKNRI